MKALCLAAVFSVCCFAFAVAPCPAGILPAGQPMAISPPEQVTPLLAAAVWPVRTRAAEPAGWDQGAPDSRPTHLLLVSTAPADVMEFSREGPVEEASPDTLPDPLEPLNRVSFAFNDKFYFWLLKPVAQGYKAILPQDLRVGVRNFYTNLNGPVRVANCLLQARFQCAGTETLRFMLNSVLGLAGFLDAGKDAKLPKEDADFGQTLGVWGFTPGFYIDWAFLGPSTLRESFGFAGDLLLDPFFYLVNHPAVYAVQPINILNETSLRIGEYEDLKEAALDPYVALKDAYFQYRENKIKKVKK